MPCHEIFIFSTLRVRNHRFDLKKNKYARFILNGRRLFSVKFIKVDNSLSTVLTGTKLKSRMLTHFSIKTGILLMEVCGNKTSCVNVTAARRHSKLSIRSSKMNELHSLVDAPIVMFTCARPPLLSITQADCLLGYSVISG